MKHAVFVKFVAMILCALSLVACVGGTMGIIFNESYGLYTDSPDAWLEDELDSIGFNIAMSSAALYSAEHLGGCDGDVLRSLEGMYYTATMARTDGWSVTLIRDGEILLEGGSAPADAWAKSYIVSPSYPSVIRDAEAAEDTMESVMQPTDGATSAPVFTEVIWVEDGYGSAYQLELAYYEGPEYEAVVSLHPEVAESFMMSFMVAMYQLRNHFIVLLFAGLLIFAATLVYLCCAAGRRPGSDKVYPVALNRIPLDIYALAGGVLEALLGWLAYEMIWEIVYSDGSWSMVYMTLLVSFLMALVAVAFIFACAAQLKTRGGFWWRRTILGWCCVRIVRGLRSVGRGCRALFRMLPLVWQWLLAGVAMVFCPLMFLLFCDASYSDWQLIWATLFVASLFVDVAVVSYWAYCMGQLLKGVQHMSQGGLHYQIPTQHLTGRFRDFAEAINSMAGAARIAAERQLKSERMKTELITNVSHDIKTPLTSIINYVDLLKKPHDDAQQQQYLDVLDRQSLRLKKLIEDLMEMSKASTGNIAVEMGRVDAAEAVNQALGEFSDKLDAADLIPVFRAPQEPVMVRADGKLLWRVMSNLLSNAVKYAMPGTRLYIDLLVIQGNAILNMKNISRDQLNVGAEELMERFVRGDASRNTEGSGLGLNIAKSLVELQKGQMHLMVDGDLFKVTLVLPLA